MNELFKLGAIKEETQAQPNLNWLEIVGGSATTTFSPNNSGVRA